MHRIDLEFQSVRALPEAVRFTITGVYVLWAPRNTGRAPTYIGDAPVLRCVRDGTWQWSELDGVVAPTRSRVEAQTAEAALLWTSAMMNRRPSYSICDDSWRHINRVMMRHPVLCIDIRGRHPFLRSTAAGSELRPSEVLPLWFDASTIQLHRPPLQKPRPVDEEAPYQDRSQ